MSSFDSSPVSVVIDNGSGYIKAGISPDNGPRVVLPSVVGRNADKQGCYVGDEAQIHREVSALSWPIQRGSIVDWDDMEKIWDHVLNKELKVTPGEQPILLTEPPLNRPENKQNIIQMMFEKFQCPAAFLGIQSVLSLYASGHTTGTVCDSGAGVTHIVPISEGYAVNKAVQKLDIAGRDLTEFITTKLQKQGLPKTEDSDTTIARAIKEKLCRVCPKDDEKRAADSTHHAAKSYELPDGTKIDINRDITGCPDMLFDPSCYGVNSQGIPEMIHSSIESCDKDSWKELYGWVLLAGGSTMFPGFTDRTSKQLKSLVPSHLKVKVTAPQERKYSAWIGGSILASLSNFQALWISKEEYDECGASIALKKSF